MKITLIILGIFAFASFNHVSAQRSQRPGSPPTDLSEIDIGRNTDSVNLLWLGNNNVVSYTVRIYRRPSNTLYKTVKNIVENVKNITNLNSGTRYYATVSAMYVNSAGVRYESPESNRTNFETDEACIDGRVFLSCTSHCVATCGNPGPICPKICVPGCGCPRSNRFLHEGRCITKAQCPPLRSAGPIKPQDLQILAGGDDTILAWTPYQNAQSYAITVRVQETREVVQEVETTIPIIVFSNLVAGETYEFAVRIVHSSPQSTVTKPAPRIVFARYISDNSFTAKWIPQSKAVSYTFVLYDESRNTVLSVQENITGSSVLVDRLAPRTTYVFAVASANAAGKLGPLSNPRQVTTTGTSVDMENVYAAVIVHTVVMTTTTAAPITTAPSSRRVTRCTQRLESVRNFYLKFPNVDGPEYPVCNSNGMYVTRKCNSATPPRQCWCIDPVYGDKVVGSEFGSENSDFELDCDHFGRLNIAGLEMEARNLSSTSVQVEWNEIESVRGYVLVVDNNLESAKTISIEGSQTISYRLNNLKAGHAFEVGVYAVDQQGRSSPMTHMEVRTALLDTPQNVAVKKLSLTSVQLSWQYSPNADGASVKLISQDTSETMRTFKVSATSVIITDLEPSRYLIEIREIRCDNICDNTRSSILQSSEAASVEVVLNACRMPVIDLIFAFDVSPGSGLQLQKEVAEEIIRRLPAVNHRTGTRMAAVQYEQHTSTVFNYENFDDASNVIDRIHNITSSTTSSNTAYMLDYVRTRFFNPRRSSSYRQRSNSVTAVVVFSGGPSRSTQALQQASSLLKKRTNVAAIGTSPTANVHVLSIVASNTDMKYVANIPEVSSMVTRLTEQFCQF